MSNQDLSLVCEKIKRWRTRLKRAVNMIDKLERQRARLEKKQAILDLDTRGTDAPKVLKPKETKPDIGWVFPVKGTSEPVDPTTQLGVLGPAPGFDSRGNRVPDDDDLAIPAALRRSPEPKQLPAPIPTAEAVRDEAEKQKKLKAIARKLKRKGTLAERETHDAIPKSKRRWDPRKSCWIEAG